MNILKRQAIAEFYEKHADARTPLETWLAISKKAEWKNFNELSLAYPNAFPIGDSRVVFDIKGNKYRMVARVLFMYKQIQIKWIGTHADYDRINAVTISR